MNLEPGFDKLRGDPGLEIGEPEHQIGFQRQDLIDLRAGEGRDLGLFPPRLRRTHGKTRDPNDAPVFPEQIQGLGGFLGQADDPLWCAYQLPPRSRFQ